MARFILLFLMLLASGFSQHDSQNGLCEPNQFQCKNGRCVLKTWLCNKQDDCGDLSDEESCESGRRVICEASEFKCRNITQCVHERFHCDGFKDCADGSDEIYCAAAHVMIPPQPANVRLRPGGTLALLCEVGGVPTPLISWRLNMSHVPPNCRSTSYNGVGTLICPNMQPEDSGVYSCEAITTNKGSIFATPGSIVHVNNLLQAPASGQATGTVTISSSADTTPVKRGKSPTYTCTLYSNQQTDDIRRVSERKCEEYSKSAVRKVYAIRLLPGLPTMLMRTAACNKTVESLPHGSTNVEPGEFPHLVSIGWGKAGVDYTYYCGGTLISPRFVLTAAWCTLDSLMLTVVRLEDRNEDPAVQDGARQVKVVPIKTIYRHPEFKSPMPNDDIALIELQNDVDIRPACLWTKPDFDGHNKAIIVSRKRWSDSYAVLQKITFSLMNKERCEQVLEADWSGVNKSTMMCASKIDDTGHKCLMHRDFPLQVHANDNQCIHYVVGIASSGRRCTTARDPIVYTRVSSYLDWIEGIVWPGE